MPWSWSVPACGLYSIPCHFIHMCVCMCATAYANWKCLFPMNEAIMCVWVCVNQYKENRNRKDGTKSNVSNSEVEMCAVICVHDILAGTHLNLGNQHDFYRKLVFGFRGAFFHHCYISISSLHISLHLYDCSNSIGFVPLWIIEESGISQPSSTNVAISLGLFLVFRTYCTVSHTWQFRIVSIYESLNFGINVLECSIGNRTQSLYVLWFSYMIMWEISIDNKIFYHHQECMHLLRCMCLGWIYAYKYLMFKF